MPINLLKLPLVLSRLIVAESEYPEIFLLSLCSRRTKVLVEKAVIKVPKLAYRIEKCERYNEFKIGVVKDNTWFPITSLLHVHELALPKILTVKLGDDYEADTNLDQWCDEDGKCLHRMECANEPMEVQKALQDHMNSLFHHSETNQLYLWTKCEGCMPNVRNVGEIEIRFDNILVFDTQFLENVLTTYSDHQNLSVISVDPLGELSNDSPVYQVQKINIACPCGPEHFHNFVGKNVRLEWTTVTEQDLIQFLHKWISNEAYHDLESMSIVSENVIDGDMVRQEIEFEEYDPDEPEKRPTEVVIDMPCISSMCLKYHLNEDFVEVKRISDGKRAFLAVGDCNFDFLVHK
ncbi:unnamed protein product [Caenorhabditis nigoni]